MFTQLHPNVTKQQYDSIRRHAVNDHECGYYQQQDIDPFSIGKWPNEPKPILTYKTNGPPSPSSSPLLHINTSSSPPPPPPLKRSFASERVPSETFGEELLRITKVNRNRIEKEMEYKKKKFDEKVKTRHDELMKFLTEKYYGEVVSCLQHNAKNGKYEAYMNFKYEDFKANMPTLGKPREIQRKWLAEMKNPNSVFLKDETYLDKRALIGISTDCWGNSAFTVHFKW